MQLAVDFQIEVLEGCRFNCPACHVDKDADLSFGEAQIARLKVLFEEFQAKGYLLDHLIVGPTDFMTAGNFEVLKNSPTFRELTRLFKATNWTTTLLSPEWRVRAQEAAAMTESATATFSLVMNPQQALNEKYLEFMQRKWLEFKKAYGKPVRRIYVLFNAYPHPTVAKVNFKRDYVKVHHIVRRYFDVPSFDHGFSFTRSDSLSQEKTRILSTMTWLNDVYSSVAEETEIPIQFLIENDSPAKRYVYRANRFYSLPLWHEPFVNFDPRLEIPVKDWRAHEFEEYEQSLLASQYNQLEKLVCNDCHFNSVCVHRGITHLMQLLDENSCLLPQAVMQKRNFEYA